MPDFNLRKLDALRELAGATQCIPGGIATVKFAVATPERQLAIAVRSVWGLALWYAPACQDRNLLSFTLAVYRTVSRKPRRLSGVVAPSATEWLLKFAQKIVKIAEEKSQVGIERIAAERRQLSGVHLQLVAERWPLICSALAELRIPPKESLEILRVEADWEYGQALRRCEKVAPATENQRGETVDERPSAPTAAYCLLLDRKARWEGEPVELQKLLWDLLEYLLTHPRYPLQQGVIEEAVWGGKEITSKTFANTISRLNTALAAISFPWTWRVSAGEIFRD